MAMLVQCLLGIALDLRSLGRGFDFHQEQGCIATLGMLFIPVCLCQQAV